MCFRKMALCEAYFRHSDTPAWVHSDYHWSHDAIKASVKRTQKMMRTKEIQCDDVIL